METHLCYQLLMLEKVDLAVDNHETYGAPLTDLSKAFNCLSHNILIAKLHYYGLSSTSLRLVSDYFSNHKQQIEV